jgi:hypothetical protein
MTGLGHPRKNSPYKPSSASYKFRPTDPSALQWSSWKLLWYRICRIPASVHPSVGEAGQLLLEQGLTYVEAVHQENSIKIEELCFIGSATRHLHEISFTSA